MSQGPPHVSNVEGTPVLFRAPSSSSVAPPKRTRCVRSTCTTSLSVCEDRHCPWTDTTETFHVFDILRCLDMLWFEEWVRRKLEMYSFWSRYQCPRCRFRCHDTVPYPDQEPLHVILGVPGQYPVLHDNLSCGSSPQSNFPERTRDFLFISSTSQDFGQEKWNFRTLALVENFPQLVVQAILVYLQGSCWENIYLIFSSPTKVRAYTHLLSPIPPLKEVITVG
jgi:hypothetical protein